MRASRLLVAVLALALLGLVPFSSQATAAQPTPSAESTSSSARLTTAAPTTARVKKLTAKIVKRRNGNLFLTGVIRPAKGPVVIQKATNCNAQKGTCNFKNFGKKKVNNKGRYTIRVFAPSNGSWAWRAKKNATTSDIWITCRKRPGATCPTP